MITNGEKIILSSASALFLSSWLGFIFYFSPTDASPIIFVLFYSSLFLFLSLFFALMENIFLKNKQRQFSEIKIKQSDGKSKIYFRHSILLATILTGSLMLKGFKIWNWLSGLAILLSVLVVEVYFWRKSRNNYF